jgi:hypothetical protein
MEQMMKEHLEKLAAHLEGLDSGSADAKAIRWALSEIDRLEEAADAARADGWEEGHQAAEESR